MTVPAMPRAGFVMIEAELVLGGFEAVLDGPAVPFDGNEGFDRGSSGAPCGEEGEVAICDIAADQETAWPLAGMTRVVFSGIEIGERVVAPVMEPGAFGPFPRREAPPRGRFNALCEVFGGAGSCWRHAPGCKMMIGRDTKYISLFGPAQGALNGADAVDAVSSDPRERDIGRDRAFDHLHCKGRLGRKVPAFRNVAPGHASRVVGPGLWQVKRPVDKGVPSGRYISGEIANLAVGDLPRRPRILTAYAARRLALFEKASLVDHQNRIRSAKRFDNIVADNVAQRIRIPAPAA